MGSSTAVFLVLDSYTARLKTANMGNSRYLIIRNGKVVFQSEAQNYRFNAPYQLALYPASVISSIKKGPLKKRMYIKEFNIDDDSFVTSHDIEPGDVVIVGSDGLFDNLFEISILHVVQAHLDILYEKYPRFYAKLKSWQETRTIAPPKVGDALLNDINTIMKTVSHDITRIANILAYNQQLKSPFSLGAEKAGYRYRGGKVDDITVIAVYVHATS